MPNTLHSGPEKINWRYKISAEVSLFILLIILIAGLAGCSQHHQNKSISFNRKKPAHIIYDADIGPDYDDVGAITILHVLADKGEAKILATVASNKYKGVAGVLDVFNTYFNRPDIPIGVPKGQALSMSDPQHWSDTLLAKYPHKIKYNRQVPGAVQVYRKVLSKQPDHSVTIETEGFLTNLAQLLASKGGKYSPLSGRELVKKKVKLLVSMAGKFPSGKEWNMSQDAQSSIQVFEHWPTPVIFSGAKIGSKIKTGLPLIHDQNVHHDPAKDVFSICIPMNPADSAGRSSWDETAVLVAVRGYKPYWTLHQGKVIISSDGSDKWDNNGSGQYYLVPKESPEKVQKVINKLMMQTPKK
ncbi:MAG TPA: nucleoside hydrolase [Balneolaceae bacterium]|nr:nucleoside hydrolase [Balneolaceae bacterium]